jgi:peptidyl-prolyl cis-trans isomerase C
MISSFRKAALAGAASLIISAPLSAQEGGKVDIDPNVFNMFLESMTRQPASQATADQVTQARNQLTDIYLLSDLPKAQELKEGARLKAQIELQTRAMLAQAVASDFLANNQATDDELRAAYDEQAAGAAGEEFKARHILVETQGEATDIIAQLDDGADFAELAKEKSTGPSGPSGGDLGWFPPDRMVTEFSQAVQNLKDGEYSKDPVQTQFGWHVILREESRDAVPPPFESVRDAIKQQVEARKLQAYIDSLRN